MDISAIQGINILTVVNHKVCVRDSLSLHGIEKMFNGLVHEVQAAFVSLNLKADA